jgi:hypothetical protein
MLTSSSGMSAAADCLAAKSVETSYKHKSCMQTSFIKRLIAQGTQTSGTEDSCLVRLSCCLSTTQLDMYLLDTAAADIGSQAATAAYFAAWAGYSLVTGACSAIIGSVTYAQAAVYGPSYCQVGCLACRKV